MYFGSLSLPSFALSDNTRAVSKLQSVHHVHVLTYIRVKYKNLTSDQSLVTFDSLDYKLTLERLIKSIERLSNNSILSLLAQVCVKV